MKTIAAFEHSKIWRSKKAIATLLVVIVALIGMIVYNSERNREYWSKQEYDIATERTRIDLLIKEVEGELATAEISAPERVEEIEERLEFIHGQRRLNYEQFVHARFSTEDKANFLATWIKRDQHLLSGLEKGYDFLDENIAEVRQRLSVNEYLAENNIEPMNSPYEMTATNFIYHLVDYPWILIVLVAISLINIDIFSGDMDGGAYKVLYSQPFKRSKILAVKYLVYMLNSFLLVTGIVILTFGIVAIINGLGNLNYPIFYHNSSYAHWVPASASALTETLIFLPWSSYILAMLPLYCLLGLFAIALMGTTSFILKNTTNVLSTLICLLFLDYSIRNLFPMESKLYAFWPLAASGLNNVFQGFYPITGLAYLVVLAGLTFLLVGAGLFFLNKWDLTGGVD